VAVHSSAVPSAAEGTVRCGAVGRLISSLCTHNSRARGNSHTVLMLDSEQARIAGSVCLHFLTNSECTS
jgi:hypothetical protein